MLELTKISHTSAYTDEWRKERFGKITASQFGRLVGESSDKGYLTKGAITYIEELVYEYYVGRPAKKEIFTDAIEHGNATEPEAVNYFSDVIGMRPLRNSDRGDTHRLIINDEHSACTPDALLSQSTDVDKLFDLSGTKIKVIPLEVKCPTQGFIKLFKCNTPKDLKTAASIYYWQVITQMMFCDSLNAFFGVYNSEFNPHGKLIEFRKIELMEDVKRFALTLHHAKIELQKTINLFTNKN